MIKHPLLTKDHAHMKRLESQILAIHEEGK